jgi:hypothetical protein
VPTTASALPSTTASALTGDRPDDLAEISLQRLLCKVVSAS